MSSAENRNAENSNAAKAKASLDPRVRVGDVAWRHIEAEYADVIDDIVETLAPDEPFAYTVAPYPTTDSSIPRQEIATTRDQIRAAYENLHRFTQVRRLQPITEIRGDWYMFAHGMGEGLIKQTGQIVSAPTVVIFPTMGTSGITGELIWTRSASGAPYTGDRQGPFAAELAIIERHDLLLNHLRSGDAESAASLLHPGAQTAIRDYVDDTGTLVALHSATDFKAYIDRFFARFRVVELSVVNRTAGDWFVFAELFWVVEEKATPAKRYRFVTAEQAEVRPDGLFAARIGHGTDLFETK